MAPCYTDPCHIKRGTLGTVSDVTEAPERIDGDGEGELTIDELAQRTGMTVRNIRAHQSRGLLPPPAVRGRTGYYGPAHLARIELIQEMQAQGLNLHATRRLVDAAPEERWPEVRAALERLRPLAADTLLAIFGVAMADASEEAFGREIERLQRRRRSSKG